MLRQHMRDETGARKKMFVCKTCKKEFNNKSVLRVHRRTHAGKLPFQCDVCGDKFLQEMTLKSHSLVHKKKKPDEAGSSENVKAPPEKKEVEIRASKRKLEAGKYEEDGSTQRTTRSTRRRLA